MASQAKNDRRIKYIYDLPYSTLQKLHDILDCDKAWEKLGGVYLKYDMTTLESFNRAVFQCGSPTRAMLARWGNSNGTVDHLFVYLYKMQHYLAMKILLPHVSDKVKHLYLNVETSTRTGMHMTNMGLNSNSNFTGQGWSATQEMPNRRLPECAGLTTTMNQSRMLQQSDHYYSHKIKQSSQHMHSKMPVEQHVPPGCTNDDSTYDIKDNVYQKSKLPSSNFNYPSSDESMRSKKMLFPKYKDHEFRHADDNKNHSITKRKDVPLVCNQLGSQHSIKIINREDSHLLGKQDNRREIPDRRTSREEYSSRNSVKSVNNVQKLMPKENAQKDEIQTKRKISDVSTPQSAVLELTYQEILAATYNFSSKVLGQGGFGTVYSGDWKGTRVAIKFIRRRTSPGRKPNNDDEKLEQSLVELKALTSCRHDNILPLYGYGLDEHGLCFVYQFMSNGSLEDRLQCKGNTAPLNWLQRCQITRGAACGIHYLHSLPKPLIHGDIKSANILLDKNFEPKIGDFGLVHEGPGPDKTTTHVFRLCGTPAYLPPEYLGKHHLSTKVDSFSFGVVLFEVATGWKALIENRVKLNLPKYLVIYIQKMTEDPDFIRDRKAGEENGELFLFFFKLGQKCTEDHKDKRPEMEQILQAIDSQLQYLAVKINARKRSIAQQVNGAGKNQQLPHPLFQVNQHDKGRHHGSVATNKDQLDSKDGVRSKENQPRKSISPVEQTTPISYSSSTDIHLNQNNVHPPDSFHADILPPSYNEVVQNLDVASPPENMKCPMSIELKPKQETCHIVSQNTDIQEPTGYLPNITLLGHKFSNENDQELGCRIENSSKLSGAVNLEKFEMPQLDAANLHDSGNCNPHNASLQTKENVLFFAESQITAQGKSVLDFDAFNTREFQEEFQNKVAL